MAKSIISRSEGTASQFPPLPCRRCGAIDVPTLGPGSGPPTAVPAGPTAYALIDHLLFIEQKWADVRRLVEELLLAEQVQS
jgi:hypothetical protein